MDNHIYEGIPSLPIAEELCKTCGHLADDIDKLHMRDANGDLLTQEDLDYVAEMQAEYDFSKAKRGVYAEQAKKGMRHIIVSDEEDRERDIDFIRDEERGK